MKKKFTQLEIIEMLKSGWSLFKSRSIGSYPGHWYMEKGDDHHNVNGISVNALIRKGIIVQSSKPRKWNDPREYVIKTI